ncbi:MAG: VanW family protein [bacterium]
MLVKRRIPHTAIQITAFFVGIGLTCLVVIGALCIGIIIQDRQSQGLIYPGVKLDNQLISGKSVVALSKHYAALNKSLSAATMELWYEEEPVATFSGSMLHIRSNGQDLVAQARAIGRDGTWTDRTLQKVQQLLKLKRYTFKSVIEVDERPLLKTLSELATQNDLAPRDALFEMADGKVTAFAPEKDGIKINQAMVLNQVQAHLSSPGVLSGAKASEPKRIIVQSDIVKPKVTLEQSNTQGIKEVIGEGKSDYTHSIPGRIHNLLLASDRLHGVLIPRGATFSYVDAVGEISARTGYQPAYVIVNGRTELGDGGGVCQTSTTIFRAAINSGLKITEWHAHAYRVGYYENDSKPGRDATVYAPSVDLKFYNDTPSAILIEVEKDEEKKLLTYRFWGTKDNRIVSISDIKTSGAIGAPAPRYQDDPTLRKGVVRQVDWAASGLTAWFDYEVTKDTKVIQKKTFTSNYRPWQAIYLVGTKE